MANGRSMRSLIIGVGVAMLAGAGAYWVATAPQRTQAKQESLVVNPAQLDLTCYRDCSLGPPLKNELPS